MIYMDPHLTMMMPIIKTFSLMQEMTDSLTQEHLLNVSVFVEFFLRGEVSPRMHAHSMICTVQALMAAVCVGTTSPSPEK